LDIILPDEEEVKKYTVENIFRVEALFVNRIFNIEKKSIN